jgi:predicted short-subunit dehydrogenase-like oxidoreductase (DUF2520 family)
LRVSRVSVVGRGRLGTAIAGALRAAGIHVAGPSARDEPVAPAEAVLLCVPDAEIAHAATAARASAPLLGHTSGATPLSELGTGAGFGLHPLQTFTGSEPPERFRGAGCAVAGTDSAALAAAEGLAHALGMNPFGDSDRAAYHAAASIASNFLVSLQAAAEDAAGAAGIPPAEARSLLAPLVRSTVENWAASGPAVALTGPVARGDEATVERQRAALAAGAPHLVQLFDVLAEHTRALAGGGREVAA